MVTELEPRGDQPAAVTALVAGVQQGHRQQTLLGVTGSGKTYTSAKVSEAVQRPTLVLAHNKTLAAQLYSEFREFFPNNAVRYFVSYYDYYQPEAYVPQTDLYISKDASINDEIDRLRHAATKALMERRDVVVVASVSCIFGLGRPEDYKEVMLLVRKGERRVREEILRRLVDIQYERNDIDFARGRFRVRGDVIEVHPSYEDRAVRIELFGDEVERIIELNPVSGEVLEEKSAIAIWPAKHWVTTDERLDRALRTIDQELRERLEWFKTQGKLLEAQRLEFRAKYDMELLREVGYCPGIENYSRHMDGRTTGLVDPHVEVRPAKGQIDDLIAEIKTQAEKGERTLVTTLTKRMAEDLTAYLQEMGLKVHYLHSEIDTLARVQILKDLRLGTYDVLVGINLLREGLDLPEVSLVAILDADREGYLRSDISLIQTMGRAARHLSGHVLLYADAVTDSMRRAIDETNRRREIQEKYNQEHGITPQSISKPIRDLIDLEQVAEEVQSYTPTEEILTAQELITLAEEQRAKVPWDIARLLMLSPQELEQTIETLEREMRKASANLEFEKAAVLRDQIGELKKGLGEPFFAGAGRGRGDGGRRGRPGGRGRWGRR